MELSNLNLADLQALRNSVQAEISRRETEEKANAKKQILELAKSYGLNLDDVLSKATTAIRKPVEAKYKNPNDESQTWTGRGRKPAWVQAQLDEGFSIEDLAI
ncbi:H-NS histone family protein [Aquitalea aquatica]|uniref:H-NS histone family protein n=1 Tax=Aquitalea aquatica TaxID=3044273 RepID=A0A838YG60_9NEIS|nr:H-NS histone family protein [Aquitalea magnusonii]MBA4709591.1 H-NS histone family protein [Aquitalea magnusonii]